MNAMKSTDGREFSGYLAQSISIDSMYDIMPCGHTRAAYQSRPCDDPNCSDHEHKIVYCVDCLKEMKP